MSRRMLVTLLVLATVAAGLYAAGQSDVQPAAEDVSVGPGPLGRYNPPVEIRVVKQVSAGQKYMGDDTAEYNIYNKWYEDTLGVRVVYPWVATSGEQYDQKLNVNIASGDVPDLFQVSRVKFEQLMEAGMLEDMSSAYEQVLMDEPRANLTDNPINMKVVTRDNRIFGIPNPKRTGYYFYFARQDWMENLGLSQPQTMEDVVELARQFTYNDPDGNGKDDTYGFGMEKGLFSWQWKITGFFNGFGAHPNIWIEDDSGSLVYGGIQPEVKEALGVLQQMYEEGLIDPEFAVKDISAVSKDIVAEKIGSFYGSQSTPISIKDLKTNNPDAEIEIMPLPSTTGEPAPYDNSPAPNAMWVVRNGYDYPEVPFKIANLHHVGGQPTHPDYDQYAIEKLYPEVIEDQYIANDITSHWLMSVRIWLVPPKKNVVDHLFMTEQLEARTPLSPEAPTGPEWNNARRKYWTPMVNYLQGDNSGWYFYRVFGPAGTQSVEKLAWDNDLYYLDKFYGVPGPEMAQKWTTLETLQQEVYTKIIVGSTPLDEFDQFVRDWQDLGGNEVTIEVNQWYDNQ